MESTVERRSLNFSSKLHREIFALVALTVFLPIILLSAVIFYISAAVNNSGGLAQNVFNGNAPIVMMSLVAAVPLLAIGMLLLCFLLTKQIVGPLERITREIDECARGTRGGPIKLRRSDRFQPLVDAINALLAAYDKARGA
jgi:nitrogen fixation/metabolism regulation signal transduction histidine kinase